MDQPQNALTSQQFYTGITFELSKLYHICDSIFTLCYGRPELIAHNKSADIESKAPAEIVNKESTNQEARAADQTPRRSIRIKDKKGKRKGKMLKLKAASVTLRDIIKN